MHSLNFPSLVLASQCFIEVSETDWEWNKGGRSGRGQVLMFWFSFFFFFTTALFFCWSCPMDVFCRSSIHLPSKLLLQHEKNDQHQILSDNLQIETWNKLFYFILLALPWRNKAKINWRYTNTENTNLTIHWSITANPRTHGPKWKSTTKPL